MKTWVSPIALKKCAWLFLSHMVSTRNLDTWGVKNTFRSYNNLDKSEWRLSSPWLYLVLRRCNTNSVIFFNKSPSKMLQKYLWDWKGLTFKKYIYISDNLGKLNPKSTTPLEFTRKLPSLNLCWYILVPSPSLNWVGK